MHRLSLRSLAAKRFRLLATALAIVLGVGFTVGTLILSDTMDRSFGGTIDEITAGVDTFVRGEQVVDPGAGAPGEAASVDASLVEVVAAVPGVAAAAPFHQGSAEVVGTDGKVLDLPQSVGVNWIDDPQLSVFELVDGRAPVATDEVALGDDTAEEAGVGVGDAVTVITSAGAERFTVTGTAAMSGGMSLGRTGLVLMSDAAADGRLGAPGTMDGVFARSSSSGAGAQDALTASIDEALADQDLIEVVTGDAYRAEQRDLVSEATTVLRSVLLAFAGIALFVGTFTIANTFTITVAQRTRELALLRAIGASRRQVIGLVLIEAVVLGAVASAVGVGAGIAMASGLIAALQGIGLEIPNPELVIAGGTVVTGLLTGLVVTVIAAISSARRAASVAPVAAMRDGVRESTTTMRRRAIAGTAVAVAAAAALAQGVATSSGSLAGLGAALAFVATVALSPVVVPAAMAVAGLVLRRLGVAGRLAVANAARNPRRSAATASALTIGVMLVVGASTFAATAKETVHGDVAAVIGADRVVRPAGSSGGVPASLAEDLEAVSGLTAVPVREAYVSVDGTVRTALGVDLEAAGELLEPTWVEQAAGDGISLTTEVAEASGSGIGDLVTVAHANGDVDEVTVTGIFEPSTVLADVIVSHGAIAERSSESLDARILLSGTAPALEAADAAVASIPTAVVETPEAFAAHRAGTLDTVLGIVVGFLGLAVVIAVLGIGTTIALSVRERTRELGVLRSIGMSRRHLRRTIRLEAISIASLGAVLGAAVGLVCTWALLRTLEDQGFADPVVPGGALVAVAIGALAAGVLSAAGPARRAARMPVLDAVRGD